MHGQIKLERWLPFVAEHFQNLDLIRFDERWAPDGHLARTVGRQTVINHHDFAHARSWELAPVIFG